MNYYVIATDRGGCEMTRSGMLICKQVILCNSLREAEKVRKMLRERSTRFSGIQMTPNAPTLNPAIYTPVLSEGSRWLQGRS